MNKKKIICIIILLLVLIIISIITYNKIAKSDDTNNISNSINLISDINYIEISVMDENANEIQYLDSITINDTNEINKLMDVIKNSYEYTNFEEDFGAGDYFEGSPILTIYMNDGRTASIVSCDKFSEDINGDFINIMNIRISDIDGYEVANTIYIEESNLEAYINNLYDMYNQVNNDELSNLDLDLGFLKIENSKDNIVYSPLSIKYALKMLEEGASGETKSQISKILGDYNFKKYTSNSNMAFANAIFIKDTYKNKIKQNYINILNNDYNADVIFDSFKTAKTINNWISNKTLNIIPEIIQDQDLTELDFTLVNALAIDMEWEEKFLLGRGENTYPSTKYSHELDIDVYDPHNVSSGTFNNDNEKLKVSGMNIYATINNYDIVNELGEDNIKKIVSDEYRKFAKNEDYDTEHAIGDYPLSEDVTDEGINKALEEFIPTYMSELNENYHKSGSSTDFYVYVDDDVKIFAKDLKEYEGTTLQYIGIMPTSSDLNQFIKNTNMAEINNYISNLKSINYQDFKEGVVTKITGYIPKFNFEYNLDLLEDLKILNITDVFDEEKADLQNITDDNSYISTALHSANIEFTQDGIKAAAATVICGAGGGAPFDYYFDVPIEEIDLTFDKPFMFLIRDKETGEAWFVGTVYEPLSWEEEPEKDNVRY